MLLYHTKCNHKKIRPSREILKTNILKAETKSWENTNKEIYLFVKVHVSYHLKYKVNNYGIFFPFLQRLIDFPKISARLLLIF